MIKEESIKSAAICIREAAPDDSADIADILQKAFGPYRHFYSEDAFRAVTPTKDEIAARFVEGPIWIAELESKAIGTVSVSNESEGLYIRSLAVIPEMQGRGIAHRLLETAMNYAESGGWERVFLYTTYFVPGARQLYEKHGFQWVRDTAREEWFDTPGLEMERILKGKNHMLLEVKNLHAGIEGREILKGLNLRVNRGEVHAIMGPNGSGKSTLSKVIAGHPSYEVTSGEVLFEGRNLLELEPDERAREGVFMAFQYPVEVPGVSNAQFLRLAYNEKRKHLGEEELDPIEFNDYLKEKARIVEMDPQFFKRSVNEGFSGGEKKRNEILQMAVLEPKLAILDETDSGLDIDALRIVAEGVNKLRSKDNAIILVTHYQRLLNYIKPDYVHVLADGKIVKEGGKELALELEEKGYDWVKAAGRQ